jgi:DNA polymerase
LDQRINARGVQIDLKLARAAIDSAERIKACMAVQVSDMTDGAVGAATQRDAMLRHLLSAYGIELPDLRTSTVEELLNGGGRFREIDLPEVARELLEIRLGASRTSTTKYQALLNATSEDGRLRGTLQFCGASRTGRWAGRVFQPQNLSRVPKYLKKQYDEAVEVIKLGAVDLLYDNPLEVLGACVRGALVAPRGKKFCISDLSNIEGRGLAWAAGENWKLKAFSDFDAGIGSDLYKLAYAKAFNVPVESVDDGDQRQVGKVMELALGYSGGVGAFVTFAAAYGIDLEALADKAQLPADVIRETEKAWDWASKNDRTYELPEKVWRVCDGFKRLWRRAHPETVAWWREVEDAARAATLNPGNVFKARSVRFAAQGAWLRMLLPSGRSLCYPSPRVSEEGVISYMGVNQFSRKWCRINTYSGKLVENAIQGIARDVLASTMPLMETNGYQIVLSIHDEVICETPDTDRYSSDGLSTILATNPDWAKGFPLAAAGFETRRYRKE